MKVNLARQAVASGAGSAVYVVPTTPDAEYATTVQCLDIVNTTSASATFNVHLIPVGDSATTANALFYQMTLGAKNTIQWTGEQVLNTGDSIHVTGSVSGLTVHISGEEVVV